MGTLAVRLAATSVVLLALAVPLRSQIPTELPDDYLVFELARQGNEFRGGAQHFEGFGIVLTFPDEGVRDQLDAERLVAYVKEEKLVGQLTYPTGRQTPVACEVVQHRGRDDVFMKTSLGYFLWEHSEISPDRIAFTIYWWYRPPATPADLEILARARELLATPEQWQEEDDRRCGEDERPEDVSLFCALKQASVEVMEEYNHHNSAMQVVRGAIEERFPGREFEHTLMDFNNDPTTRHANILEVLDQASERIAEELAREP